MSIRFSIDGQVIDIVHVSQSGQIIHQHRVRFQQTGDISRFVDDLLAQNAGQLPELRRFLGLPSSEAPRETLIDQLGKGQLRAQTGALSHAGGPAKAPHAPSRRQNTGPRSKIYSDSMLRQLEHPDSENSGRDPRVSHQPNRATTSPETTANAAPADTRYKISVELAGRARCFKQRLEINQLNEGTQPGERQQRQSPKPDHESPHRCLIEFQGLSNAPRNLDLVISTSGSAGDIRLPLVESHPVAEKSTGKEEWDTVIIPIKPLGYINKQRDRRQADLLRPGYVYVFWQGRLWRELEVNRNNSFRDIDVQAYRNGGATDTENTRQAEGHWLNEIWLPYKLKGADQSDQIQLLYSECQLDFSYIENLENDSGKLASISTAASELKNYSSQKSFNSCTADIGAITTALLDQQIDPDAGYQVVSKKGHQLNRSRNHNIPVAYLEPLGEKFALKVEDENGRPFTNRSINLNHGGNIITAVTDSNGIVEIPLPEAIDAAELELSLGEDQPLRRLPFECLQSAIEPVATVKGQQLRLNNLGYNAGVVDGINGRRTRAAARAFQKDSNLQVDGIIGPMTQSELKSRYGR